METTDMIMPASNARRPRIIKTRVLLMALMLAGGTIVSTFVQATEAPDLQLYKIIPVDASASDNFGQKVAVEGNTLVVGVQAADVNGASDAGAVYVYARSGPEWIRTHRITASDGAAFDRFGSSVAISGDTIVVGALLDDDSGTNSGSAYVYVRQGAGWGGEVKLTASTGAAFDQFGISAAIDGDTIVVGADQDDDKGADSGSAFIFRRNAGSWSQVAGLTATNGAAGDKFGASVAVDADRVFVGAWQADRGATNTGSVYVFRSAGATWTQETELVPGGLGDNHRVGVGVAASNGTLLFGSSSATAVGNATKGAAYAYSLQSTGWSFQGRLAAQDGELNDLFGTTTDIDGDVAIVGANRADVNAADSGAAYVFVRANGSWTQRAKLSAADGASSDAFGVSVALSGENAVVGALADEQPGGPTNAGSVYTYVPTLDSTPPTIGIVQDIVAEATSAAGAIVTYLSPDATDDRDPDPVVSCQPASGSVFPLGQTIATCHATDDAGNVAASPFNVTVMDTTAPILELHDNLVVEGGVDGATVTYDVPYATDAVAGTFPSNCTPASGTLFPRGRTTVSCVATDQAGNTAQGSFTVDVEFHTTLAISTTREEYDAIGAVTDGIVGAVTVLAGDGSGVAGVAINIRGYRIVAPAGEFSIGELDGVTGADGVLTFSLGPEFRLPSHYRLEARGVGPGIVVEDTAEYHVRATPGV